MRRRWRSFVAADFEADLSSSRLCNDLDNLDQLSADELMEMYDSEMLLLLDKHCPRVEVKQNCRTVLGWRHGLTRNAASLVVMSECWRDVIEDRGRKQTRVLGCQR